MISNDPLYAAGSAWFTTTLFPGTRKCGVAVVTVIVYGPVRVLLILLIATKWLENRSTHMAPVGAAEGVEAIVYWNVVEVLLVILKEPLNGLSAEPFTSAPAIRTQSFTARPCGKSVVTVAVVPEKLI